MGTNYLFMQHHEWILEILCWVKEALDKRVHTVWLHLHEVLKRAELIDGKKKKNENTVVVGEGGLTEGAQGNFLDDNILYFDRGLGYTGICISETHWIMLLTWMHFTLRKFSLKEEIVNFCQWWIYWNVWGEISKSAPYTEMHQQRGGGGGDGFIGGWRIDKW